MTRHMTSPSAAGGGHAAPYRRGRVGSDTVRVLTRRELGRALLARNLLLERLALDPLAAVRHLGYDDRSRVVDDEHRGLSVAGARMLLVDGRVAATWTTRVGEDETVLEVAPLRELARTEDIDAEAHRMLAALAPEGAVRRVEWRSSV